MFLHNWTSYHLITKHLNMLKMWYSWYAFSETIPLMLANIFRWKYRHNVQKSAARETCIVGMHITTSLCIIENQATVMANLPLMYIYGFFFLSSCVVFCLFVFWRGQSEILISELKNKNPQWTRKESLQAIGRTSLHASACLPGMNCICFSKVKTQILQIERPYLELLNSFSLTLSPLPALQHGKRQHSG